MIVCGAGVRSHQRVLPPQASETREVAVCCDPFATRFDSERGEIGVGDEVPLGTPIAAQPPEDAPVTLARRHRDRIRVVPDLVCEGQRDIERRRLLERWWVATRTKPLSTSSDTANADSLVTMSSSQPL